MVTQSGNMIESVVSKISQIYLPHLCANDVFALMARFGRTSPHHLKILKALNYTIVLM